MSFLDSLIVAGGDVTQAAFLELATEVEAQQTALAALQATNTAQDAGLAARAAADAAQDASIAAQAALNTAQQAAIDAEAAARSATDSAQSTAIAGLQTSRDTHAAQIASIVTRYNEGDGLRVEKFASGGVLTRMNFDAALRAAAQACTDEYDDTGFTPRMVQLPAGTWDIDAAGGPVVIPGTYGVHGIVSQGRTPGVFGAGGASGTCLLIQGNYAPGRGVFEWGVPGGHTTVGVKAFGFTIETMSGAAFGSGIRFRAEALVTELRDIYIRGFSAAQSHDDGIGIAFDTPTIAGVHQHLTMHNVSAQNCQLGAKLNRIAQMTATQLHLNQNLWMSATVDSVAGTWLGGTMQDGSLLNTEQKANYWYGGTLLPSCATGFGEVVLSGTGASLSVATYATDAESGVSGGGTCVVTDLSDLETAHQGCWLYLSNGEAYGYGIIRGMYQIKTVLSPSSCVIYKGTSHAAVGSLTWEVRAHLANYLKTDGYIYHEAPKRCVWFIGPQATNGTESISIHNHQGQNTIPVIAEGGNGSLELDLQNIRNSGTPKAFVRSCRSLTTNHPVASETSNDINIDDYTRTHMAKFNKIIHRSRRLSQYAAERGGHYYTPQRTDKVSLTGGTNVTELRSTGSDAIKLVPKHAAQYCTYDAADPNFGASITLLCGSAGATFKALTGAIPGASLPQRPYFPTLFFIGRLLDTAGTGGLTRRIMLSSDGGAASVSLLLDDRTFWPSGSGSVRWASTSFNATTQPSDLVTPTTNPFVLISGGNYLDGYGLGGVHVGYSLMQQALHVIPGGIYKSYFPGNTNLTLEAAWEYDQIATTGVVMGGILMLPYCPPEEIDVVRGMIASEYSFRL